MSSVLRSDLILEASAFSGINLSSDKLPEGVRYSERISNSFKVEELEIFTPSASEKIGKPIGNYFTLSLDGLIYRHSEAFPHAVEELAGIISQCIKDAEFLLVAALGNKDITPDTLGCIAADNIVITRHFKNSANENFFNFKNVALCRTGVLGTTGLESAEHIRMLCNELKPDAVIAIDALAAADISRLCTTVQISTAGIAPGSGVGNNRAALNYDFLKVPVTAIGVPTVIDACSICDSEKFKGLFVTPRDIDSQVKLCGRLIAYAVNLALHKLSVSDSDMLIG